MGESVDQVTRRLVAWIEAALPGQPVAVVASTATEMPEGATVRLRRAIPQRRPAEAQSPLALMLHYEIAVRLADPLAEQRAIGELAFAALAEADFEIEAEGGEHGPPTLMLRTRLLRGRPLSRQARVREPLRADLRVIGSLQGVVLGPGDLPIPDAVVAIPAIGQRTSTDADGRFRFAAAPAGSEPLALTVDAKGVRVDLVATPGGPVTIRVPLES
jgi:hypothetical protein